MADTAAKILISACLLGRPVRYDGRGRLLRSDFLARWQAEGRLVPLCPEIAGGLPTPRPPAEIVPDANGADVWAGRAAIRDIASRDVTPAFMDGARIAVELAKAQGCRFALLTEGSPSCGVDEIYSGHHDGQRRAGQGVVAAALSAHGIAVFPDTRVNDLARALSS